MDVYEITGFRTALAKDGVNYLEPGDSFQSLINGYVYRQVLQSRRGIGYFAPQLAGNTRIFGIFEHILPDSTKELLAFDRNFLYKYNISTGVFDQIPFGGTMVGYAGFNITANDFYISGASYPTKTNTPRFVFCGQGIAANLASSSIFFYDGTNVLDYTNVLDNPDYAPPLTGALTKSRYVVYFNERINFVVPTTGAIEYFQGYLFSGIRDSSGNGDKFNVPGSGLNQLDTSQTIRGVQINGQILNLNADRSDWVLEKTTDAFNPYFQRRVPGVLGTSADFSSVVWENEVKSVGITGLLTCEGRTNLRFDDKIPYFTRDDIAPLDFNLTYGGFNRNTNQFLWAYKDATSESTTQTNVLVYNYEENSWAIFDYRASVFGQTDLGIDKPWDEIEYVAPDGNPSWDAWDTTEDIWDRIGIGLSVQKTLAGDDLGFIYELDVDDDDYYALISGITQAAQAVVTVSVPGILVGDRVVVSNVEGMTEINNFDPNADTDPDFLAYEVVAIGVGTITLNVDSSLFTAYTSGGNISKVISFRASTIPFNPYRDIGRRCYVSHLEFLIDSNGGYLKVSATEDEEESPYIQDVLLLPDQSSTKARQWITMTVDNEANFHTFILKQESPNVQVKVTSIRIHAAPGGMTSG